LAGETPDVPQARIIKMREQIDASVKDAIRGAQDFRDFFDDQDDLIGFGDRFFDANQIKDAADVANPINIAINIHRKKIVKIQNQEFTIIDEYDVFGHFIASTPKRPGSLNWPEYEGYDKAIAKFTKVKSAIDTLKLKMLKAGGTVDPKLAGELCKLKKEVLPRAKQDLIDKFPSEWKGRSESCAVPEAEK
jgi:hypothetical protein